MPSSTSTDGSTLISADEPDETWMADRQSSGINPEPNGASDPPMLLELGDGHVYRGYSFGATRSIAGELVFQTGMVGYPESITDPSYRGQILVVTFPLVGNYGVPSREIRDALLDGLPAYFEASQIHIAGLVVASYSGEEYSHHLATSSLGTWLKEQGVPAIYGLDTRLLTKKIREKGSMLGRLRHQSEQKTNSIVSNHAHSIDVINGALDHNQEPPFEAIDWFDPNTKNLVADGESLGFSKISWLLCTNASN